MSDLEDDYNPRAHTNLLQAISGLKKTQHIRQSTRSEPKIRQDEFELVKGTNVVTSQHEAETHKPSAVGINDLVEVLHETKQHLDAGKLLKNVHKTKKVFRKPLEKPAAERIKRQIGYENVKANLKRWDAVVSKNRTSETQVFPLPSETVYINTSLYAKPLEHTIKSDLRRDMEAAEEKLRQLKRQREGDFEDEGALEKRQQELHQIKLTRDELIARRKELAYLKMRESQQSAKARLRNKIKSKKYHKLLRRQKLQEQLKEFEQLQKTDPEAALEKLNELEKSRVRERATLRHKNTGAWAKNLQVRAKYDKDVRKDLAEQLQMSRQLTQKSKVSDDEDSDKETGVAIKVEPEENAEIYDDPMNPWITTTRKTAATNKPSSKEPDENWRKYWMDRNRNEKLLDAYKSDLNEAKKEKEKEVQDTSENVEATIKDEVAEKRKAPKRANVAQKSNAKSQAPQKVPKFENGWVVEEIEPETNRAKTVSKPLPDIDDLFDKVEERIETRAQQKLDRLSKKAKQLSKSAKPQKKEKESTKEHDELQHLKDLSFKEKLKYPKLDEELGGEDETAKSKSTISSTATTDKAKKGASSAAPESTTQANIDPTNFPTVTLKQPHLKALTTTIDADGIGDADMDDFDGVLNEHQMTISEAFEDDDIVADFGQEKSKDAELKNTEIELTMPGWGSWGGAGIVETEARKPNKRIVLKLAPEEKRRDENKDAVFINEEASKQLRPHLVSDLPFPFTSLQDYEASIRAPIGRNFVPETAFRMLTRPAIMTRKGAIIEPMDEEELTKKPTKPHTVVDRRIKRAANTAAVK